MSETRNTEDEIWEKIVYDAQRYDGTQPSMMQVVMFFKERYEIKQKTDPSNNHQTEMDYRDGFSKLLAKFDNGEELYKTNMLFVNCVKCLLGGADVYKMLESVIVSNAEIMKKYTELITSGTLRQEIVVSAERFNEMVKEIKTGQ